MERRPELTIIAGPNGAGKSRLCPFYVSAKSFDGDKQMLDIRREHPDWPDRWVSGTVASQLEKQKAEALEQHKDFAFETNFSSDMVLHMNTLINILFFDIEETVIVALLSQCLQVVV